MTQIKLFIATSLDGYIADPEGQVNWLFTDSDYGYTPFFESIEILVMGRRTYDQILSFGEWPYGTKTTFVFTRDPQRHPSPLDPSPVQFTCQTVQLWMESLDPPSSGDIWLVGGAALIALFRQARLIDHYILSIHPIILGSGIPLFAGEQPEQDLKLIRAEPYASGLVQVHYQTVCEIEAAEVRLS